MPVASIIAVAENVLLLFGTGMSLLQLQQQHTSPLSSCTASLPCCPAAATLIITELSCSSNQQYRHTINSCYVDIQLTVVCRYGQYQWAGYNCNVFKQGHGGHPSGWALSSACALRWTRPLLQANVGFLFGAPAVAALAAIAIMGLREHRPGSGRVAETKASLQSWGSTMIPPR